MGDDWAGAQRSYDDILVSDELNVVVASEKGTPGKEFEKNTASTEDVSGWAVLYIKKRLWSFIVPSAS